MGSNRQKDARITPEDKEVLAKLLDIETNQVRDSGVEIGHSHWQHDYWKEYIFLAWGWPTEEKGYMDLCD